MRCHTIITCLPVFLFHWAESNVRAETISLVPPSVPSTMPSHFVDAQETCWINYQLNEWMNELLWDLLSLSLGVSLELSFSRDGNISLCIIIAWLFFHYPFNPGWNLWGSLLYSQSPAQTLAHSRHLISIGCWTWMKILSISLTKTN